MRVIDNTDEITYLDGFDAEEPDLLHLGTADFRRARPPMKHGQSPPESHWPIHSSLCWLFELIRYAFIFPGTLSSMEYRNLLFGCITINSADLTFLSICTNKNVNGFI